MARADALDREAPRGPLHGVPFAVKNLFDVEGLTTLAGSIIERDRPPAGRSAFAVRRLEEAGAVLLGTLNMDEYACGFTTENTHYGPTRNPHDLTRIAGGSSGGSGAAVAAGMVPFALGSDTNGSIRVPAACCGVFGLKPTYGRLSRAGTVPFAESFDHVGPLAADLATLAAAYEAMQGADPEDPVQAERPFEPAGGAPARPAAALAAGPHFERVDAEGAALARKAAEALGARDLVLPGVEDAWHAAVVITLSEGASVHMEDLRTRAHDFDPMTRFNFLSAALVPAEAYITAQRARRRARDRIIAALAGVDVLVTPGTPFAACPIGSDAFDVAGETMNPRGDLGLFTQPFSCVGLPAMMVPMRGKGPLPRAVQLVGRPFGEAHLFAAARHLQDAGLAGATIRQGPW